MADNNNNGSSSSDNNNDPLDNQARQKQDIKRLLAGQSISPPSLASTLPTTTTNNNDKSEASPSTTATPQPLREDKLKLAVSFLSSPKVQAADKSKKTAFLKQKGLTDAEVEEAYRRTSGSNDNGTPSTTPQATATPTTIPTRPSPPVSSTLPPVVPTRAPPTRPTQIVYYSEPDPPRLTGRRMLALALLFGAGAVGLTAGLVGIVRGFISPIFNSIAGYQRNRYNDRNEKLSKLNNTLRLHLPEDAPLDDSSSSSNDTGYWSPLLTEQRTLMERLERLVQLSQKCADQEEPYGKFKNTLLDLKEVLNRPEYNFSTYTPYSMYGSTFANRSNTGFDDTAVQGVKSEIRSFKGMLLSRRNFPTAQVKPAATPSPPPSAPPADNTQAYHPRQRQTPSYRSDLQAKPEEQDTAKGNTTSIEDITEPTDK